MRPDYTAVTEMPGGCITRESLAMLYTRYFVASGFCEDKDVLEVSCGAGLGLGYLARKAQKVVGGDYTEFLLRKAHNHYKGRVPLLRLDAHELPFKDSSFDTILLFEAIYYLREPEKFFAECKRLLRRKGTLLLCFANKDRLGFNPSPYSTRYLSITELNLILAECGFDAEYFGAFPSATLSIKSKLVSFVRRVAVAWYLIPRTMKGKEVLKRLFYGKLSIVKEEVEDGMGDAQPLISICNGSNSDRFKVLYAIAHHA